MIFFSQTNKQGEKKNAKHLRTNFRRRYEKDIIVATVACAEIQAHGNKTITSRPLINDGKLKYIKKGHCCLEFFFPYFMRIIIFLFLMPG